MRVRPRSDLDAEFLLYALLSPEGRAYFERSARGTSGSMVKIDRAILENFPLRLPPLSAQRKIAAILSSVDETIEKTEAVIDQLEVVKNGLLSELLTRGMPGRHSTFRETEIGRIPAGWQLLALGDLLSAIEAGWSPQCEPRLAEESEWGILKVSAVSSGDYVSEEHKALPSALEPRPEIEVKPGDVLIARANGVLALVGRSAFVHSTRPRLMLSDKTLRLRPNPDRLDGFFLHLMLGFEPVRAQVVEGTTGSHMRNVSQAALRRVMLPVPPPDEQRSIATIILGIDRRTTAEREALRGLRVVKAALLDALISGRIRVNVPVQEAA
ncbi:restriction endonuclease subunit S [Myxococcus stipitatus]|nr:restriction endonuclease subunit S [Myxococcus stipitatus]